MKLGQYFSNLFSGAKNASQPVTQKKKKRIYSQIKRQRAYRTELEMDKLGQAIESARDPERPNREDLLSIYSQIQKDRHLKSQVETAINEIQQSEYTIKIDGKDDDELKDLFDREWMDDFIQYASESEFWGHSLIEIPEVNEAQEFDACYLIDRENVEPLQGNVILDKQSNTLLPYKDNLEELNLIEIEGKEDLGIFEYAAEEVILKKYARSDWSQASEKYGMPFLDYATDTEDVKELDKIEEMCSNFAANGYIVRGKDDLVEIKQAQSGDFYKIYMEAITFSNQENSKLINGQTATAESQAFVGTAEVHERIMGVFTRARLRRIQNHVNGKLIPAMIRNGYINADKLANAKFQYTDLLKKQPVPEPVEGDPANPEPEKTAKNKAVLSKKKALVAPRGARYLAKVDKTLEAWLRRFFDGQQGIDPEVWRLNFESLMKSIDEAGISFATDYKFANLASELRINAASFSAFKNHNEQGKLRDLLVDADGKPRSWNDFFKEARPITQEYNMTWLETEHSQAVASSQMAEKWAGFEENADIYPNLEYRAVTDDQTRPEHARLNGIIRPKDDPFWDKNYGPNGWGCRCSATQTDKAVTKSIDYTPPKGFDFNPGKDKKLFADSNGYRAEVAKKEAKDVTKQADKLLADYLAD